MQLHTVYSTLDNPPNRAYLIIGYILLALFVCFCIAMYYSGKGKKASITLNSGLKINPFLAIILPAVLFSSFYLYTKQLEIDIYQHDKALLNNNSKEIKVIEGNVKDFYPESKEGHGEEFTVKDTLFHYSHYEIGRSGYHQTFLYGGFIRQNLYVRITYYYDGDRNAILKLETE